MYSIYYYLSIFAEKIQTTAKGNSQVHRWKDSRDERNHPGDASYQNVHVGEGVCKSGWSLPQVFIYYIW